MMPSTEAAREMIEAAFPPELQPIDAEIRAIAAYLEKLQSPDVQAALQKLGRAIVQCARAIERDYPDIVAEVERRGRERRRGCSG